jgi:polysaccharide biosynthesis/export protein
MKLISSLLLISAVFFSAGCQTQNPADATSGRGSAISQVNDTLAPGDTLRIVFTGAPELSMTQRIRSDGKISLPKIGEIEAAGMKPSSLQARLVKLYTESLQNPEIVVIVESNAFPVIVLGAVNGGGEVNLERPTLLQAIGKAGGITRGLGGASKIRILHEGEDGTTARVVNLQAVLEGRSNEVIYVERGDIVIVPEKWL